MQACVDHVIYQIPNSFTRATYILISVENTDLGLQTVMAQVRTDTERMKIFEATASYLLLYDHVSKKHITNINQVSVDISDTTGSAISASASKVATGKIGVEF